MHPSEFPCVPTNCAGKGDILGSYTSNSKLYKLMKFPYSALFVLLSSLQTDFQTESCKKVPSISLKDKSILVIKWSMVMPRSSRNPNMHKLPIASVQHFFFSKLDTCSKVYNILSVLNTKLNREISHYFSLKIITYHNKSKQIILLKANNLYGISYVFRKSVAELFLCPNFLTSGQPMQMIQHLWLSVLHLYKNFHKKTKLFLITKYLILYTTV